MARMRQLSFLLAVLFSNLVLIAPTALAAGDESILTGEVGRLNNQSLLWGPYRPNLYFGVRPRIPKSLMAGLMWGKIETYNDFQNSRFPIAPARIPAGGRRLTRTMTRRRPIHVRAERGNEGLRLGRV